MEKRILPSGAQQRLQKGRVFFRRKDGRDLLSAQITAFDRLDLIESECRRDVAHSRTRPGQSSPGWAGRQPESGADSSPLAPTSQISSVCRSGSKRLKATSDPSGETDADACVVHDLLWSHRPGSRGTREMSLTAESSHLSLESIALQLG